MNKNKRNDVKVAYDMTIVQLGWAAWLIAITLMIFIGIRYFSADKNLGIEGFINFIENPYKIFMLVVGILSVPSFLSYYVKLGVTRKHYFIGTALSSAALSVIFMVIALIIGGIEQLIAPSDVQTFLGVKSSWLFIFIVFSLNIFIYYIAGWMIGAGYYRLGGWGLLFTINGALALIFLMDLLWSRELNTPLHSLLSNYTPENLSLVISFGASFALIAFSLWIIRALTKRVRIKM
ncbi:hypothetical protein [Jeotgalibacillus campisalis]|uniref:Uncharacterized protein n=1 Tax=Jeotgalibacillus campisalis TaxID=220754 RepID=A0A0C2VDZ6_9BACL|nr:hypothetical protein [Jeotgalibacillus campisalis]KIL47147.1 hypothetical protein KR50_24690 [Jeotgalibacillus campisalis]